jgi:hypothetical protein
MKNSVVKNARYPVMIKLLSLIQEAGSLNGKIQATIINKKQMVYHLKASLKTTIIIMLSEAKHLCFCVFRFFTGFRMTTTGFSELPLKHSITIVALAASAFSSVLLGQDVRKEAVEDMIKLRTSFSQPSSYSMNMLYRFYPTYTSQEPVEKHSAYYCKQGEALSYTQLYGTTTIVNGEWVVLKDDSSKTIMVKKYYKEETPLLSHEQLEKMLTLCSSVSKSPKPGEGRKGYILKFADKIDYLVKLEVVFDTAAYVMHGVRMYFDYPSQKHYHSSQESDPEYTQPRLEIDYANVKINAPVNKDVFSIKKYLVRAKDKWQLTSAYSSKYTLQDQTIVNK